ncbi:hypothetical protein LCC91_03315 [Tepidimonas taiwanensis]|nr:hypothetical protein [Tepidimonas taiwanensis]UBQ06146.1 hypothetical protein LCC91_03315 [Tepidimonas taiwanensis]
MLNTMVKPRKILIGPVEIAGYYRNLAEGFHQIGAPCDFITYGSHPFGYGGETEQPVLLRMARWFGDFRRNRPRSWRTRLFADLPWAVLVSIWAVWAILRYDVFIFGFGETLLPRNLDLPILHKLGKTVIANLGHGSEARPPYVDGAQQSAEGEAVSGAALISLTRRNKRRVTIHEKYCKIVIGAPYSTTQFSSRRLINFFSLGIPIRLHASAIISARPANVKRSKTPVRILHAPSHPAAKGTQQIVGAIERLRSRGHAIDLVLIIGQPFREVVEALQNCDFVVDQLFSDTPMAGFATEAAWFGKPAVVGGYGLDRLKSYVPDGMWPPSKICRPDDIEKAIEELIVDVDQRHRLGQEAQKFVREKWNPRAVAERFLRLIDGDIPEAWWLDPQAVTYVQGCGQSETRSRQMIQSLVETYGVPALELEHRPNLRDAFLTFAGIPNSLGE